jgi:hypothetical protein
VKNVETPGPGREPWERWAFQNESPERVAQRAPPFQHQARLRRSQQQGNLIFPMSRFLGYLIDKHQYRPYNLIQVP